MTVEAANPNADLDVGEQGGRNTFMWFLHQKKQSVYFYHYQKSNAHFKF